MGPGVNGMSMGSYGIWIWPAYGITGFIFVLNYILYRIEKKQCIQLVKKN